MAQPTGTGRNKSRAKLYVTVDELYESIFSEGIATASSPDTSNTDAGKSIPLKSADGTIIGYLAVWPDVDLKT